GDERAQRARRRHDRVVLAGGLEAEPAQAGADIVEAALLGQSRRLREAAPEGGAHLVEVGAALGEEPDEILVVVRRKLDGGQLGRGAVGLRRPAGPRAAAAADEGGLEQ